MSLVETLYAVLIVALCAHGWHRYVLAWRFFRSRGAPPVAPPLAGDLPWVTVQLPVYNERDVVGRLVDAAAALDWPPSRLHIQLLDDSTDDTGSCAGPAIARARSAGIAVDVLHRKDRRGFKAGALAAGLHGAKGDVIAIFDADFVPGPDFLRRMLPHFADPGVGMVQARWGHLNAEESALTRSQQLMLDAHFRVEQLSRNRCGAWFNFNGTAGIWRRAAIEAAGGWEGDTLTEDLDLSYRAQLAGWRFVYVDDVVVPAELPSTMAAFRAQQYRWAKGSVETFRKLGGRIARSDAPLFVKAEALHHLTANLAWPLAMVVAVIMPALAMFGPEGSAVRYLFLDVPGFVFATFSHAFFFSLPPLAGAPSEGERRVAPRLSDVPAAVALASGLALSQTSAVVAALLGRRSAFIRTPKQGRGAGSYRADEHGGRVELILAGWHLLGIVGACALGRWGSVPFLTLFVAGFSWVGVQSWRERRPVVAAPVDEEQVLAK